MRYKDNCLDKIFVDELSHNFKHQVDWKPNNSAGITSYPYMDNPIYLLMGMSFFERKTPDIIEYGPKMNLNIKLINLFYHIKKTFDKPDLTLQKIVGNLQFKGMDGGLHRDDNGSGIGTSYILLFSPCNEVDNIGGGFYNDTVKEEVDFKHGRIIEINSSDLHRGKAFDEPYKIRFSVRFTGI
jgi:hypothetical protein